MIEDLDEELQKFALRFDDDIKRPLVNAGFDEFNVFDILNISRQELRHSDFLAYSFTQRRGGLAILKKFFDSFSGR